MAKTTFKGRVFLKGRSLQGLFEFYLCASLFEFLLDFLGIRFASSLFNDRWCTFNHFLGLFQTEAGDATHLLNDRNFL